MRITMFTDSYYPYISGVTRAVATLRQTLESLGHQVAVFCPSYPNTRQEDGVHRLPSIKAPTNSTYYVAVPPFFGLTGRALATMPDVIHIHSPFNLGKAGYSLARRHGVPVVMTYHTMYNMYSHYVPVAGRRVSKIVEGIAFRTAEAVDAVITPSNALAGYLKENGVRTPMFPIPNGIQIRSFQDGDSAYVRAKYGIPKDVPIIISCGRLGVEKNIDTLLDAFSLVAKAKDAALLLVGDGPLRERLKARAESLGIGDRTYFAGSVQPDLMPHMYAGADLFLFASLTDTQGLVLVEAKAAGLPAVAVGALGVKDMVAHGEDGFLCENDARELAQRTIGLLTDSAALARMKRKAAENAAAFSAEASARKVLTCYESIAGVRTRG